MKYRRKLIEIDLPLDEISRESAKEKALTHGHPQTLHRWWARRPLAACRAVIFSSIIDDPADCPDEFRTEQEVIDKRGELHDIIRQLVKWDATDYRSASTRELMSKVRYEIARSIARNVGDKLPLSVASAEEYLASQSCLLTIYDPFCGGGSVPHEAQRLGLSSVAADSNPVAVLITKALVQVTQPFVNRRPVNPEASNIRTQSPKHSKGQGVEWRGSSGIANDVRYYGRLVLERTFEQIGRFYPDVQILGGRRATVTAWIWANTVECSHVHCRAVIPLVKTYQLTTIGEKHWVKPNISRDSRSVNFTIQRTDLGIPDQPTMRGINIVCLACNHPSSLEYVRNQASSGKLGIQMVAIVAHNGRERHFVAPSAHQVEMAERARPRSTPSGDLPTLALGFSVQNYGFTQWSHLYTKRQLLCLSTLSESIQEISDAVIEDGSDREYANAIKTYLSLALGRTAETNCRFTRWVNSGDKVAGVFGRQTLNMVWDFAEPNLFSNRTQCWSNQVNWIAKVLERLPDDLPVSDVRMEDASGPTDPIGNSIVVTDPPYYDNIGYADLSDFFYVWLRPLLKDVYPHLFTGMQVPKHDQIVAAPIFREPRLHFTNKLTEALKRIRESCSDAYPSSIFYAYRQTDVSDNGDAATGWHAMLESLIASGFKIVGTWPIRTEHPGRLRSQRSNALATSVLLVCRRRRHDATVTTRSNFVAELEEQLPVALDRLTRDNHIEPLDLEQAAIGPGMEVYSKYRSVETNQGLKVGVADALHHINRVIAAYVDREEGELVGELDAQTQFCLSWIKQYGFNQGSYGDAEKLANPKGVSIDQMRELEAKAGRVRVIDFRQCVPQMSLKRVSQSTSIWEGCMLMAYDFGVPKGERVTGAAKVYSKMGSNAEKVERLARILFDRFERRTESNQSRVFNDIVASWQDIRKAAEADQASLVV